MEGNRQKETKIDGGKKVLSLARSVVLSSKDLEVSNMLIGILIH